MPSPRPTSPLPKKFIKPVNMTLPVALGQIMAGRKIHKLEWQDKGFFVVLHEGKLCLHKPDGTLYSWIISDGDLQGNDYIVL